MVITEKTKLKNIADVLTVASVANVDLMQECAKFPMPETIKGVRVEPFYSISFKNLAWLWDISVPEEKVIAIAEVFIYCNLSERDKKRNPDSEKWAKRWLPDVPLIDFYRVANEVNASIVSAAADFAKMQVNLTAEEKEAGYGAKDNNAIQKMVDAFARRQRISSHEDAANYPWTIYKFVFQIDIDEQNRQRKLNEITAKKHKKK
jgi:hypothetical protein